jgi:hypothetical protein
MNDYIQLYYSLAQTDISSQNFEVLLVNVLTTKDFLIVYLLHLRKYISLLIKTTSTHIFHVFRTTTILKYNTNLKLT